MASPIRCSSAEPVQPTEYQLKAAVLGNLAKFVEWPERVFATPDSPILLGVLGADPFGSDLETIFRSINVNGRSWKISRANDVAELTSCHLLFISASEADRLARILPAAAKRPILTVSDTPRFLDRGGMIHFLMEGKKVRFEINRAAAQEAGLNLSAQLLRLARTVKEAPAPK